MAEIVTRKENKRRLATLIACGAISTISLAVGIYSMKGAGDIENDPKSSETIGKLKQEIAKHRDEYRTVQESFGLFSRKIGWNNDCEISYDRPGTTGVSGAHLKSYLDFWLKDLQRPEYGSNAVSPTEFHPWGQQGQGGPLLLNKLFDKFAALEANYDADSKKIEGQIREEISKAEAAQQEIDRIQKGNLDGIDQQKGDLKSLLNDLNVKERSNYDEIVKKEAETFEKQHELTKHKNDNIKQQIVLDQQLQDLRSRINWIRYRREEAREHKEPAGTILSVDTKGDIAFIDLLRRNRLFSGTVFKVYSLEKGGIKKDKGEIEVVEVREELSSKVAVIKTYDPADPIKAGDRIYNEYYEKDKPRYFAIAGRLTGKLSNEEAAKLLRDKGDFYQESVDEKTNYVVLADGFAGLDGDFFNEDQKKDDHPNFKLAREWCVKLILERSLLEYLGVK